MPDFDDMPQSFSYNQDGTVAYVEASDGVNRWRQTWTYSAGKLLGISAWIKQ